MADQMNTDASEQLDGGNPAPVVVDSDGAEGVDLGKVRELILAANPDVVPELIQGASFDALLASVEQARAAYVAVAAKVGAQPVVPGGQPGRQAVDGRIEGLSPGAKIAEGLRRRG